MENFDWQPYKEAIERYGKDLLLQIITIIRPHIPLFLENQEILSIAILLAGMLAPIAIGSAVMTADLLGKVTLFGMSVTTNAAKLTLAVAKTAIEVPVVLVTKPLYWLTSPFRKGNRSQELSSLMKDQWKP